MQNDELEHVGFRMLKLKSGSRSSGSQMLRNSPTAGHPLFVNAVQEPSAAVERLKSTLGVTLPADFEWFVVSLGSGATAAFAGTRRAIEDTLRFRAAVSLPQQYVVLDDRNDAGVVLLDTRSMDGAVLWVDMHSACKLAQGPLPASEHDVYPTFEAWLRWCIEEVGDEP